MSGIGLYSLKYKSLGGVDKLGELKKFLIGVWNMCTTMSP